MTSSLRAALGTLLAAALPLSSSPVLAVHVSGRIAPARGAAAGMEVPSVAVPAPDLSAPDRPIAFLPGPIGLEPSAISAAEPVPRSSGFDGGLVLDGPALAQPLLEQPAPEEHSAAAETPADGLERVRRQAEPALDAAADGGTSPSDLRSAGVLLETTLSGERARDHGILPVAVGGAVIEAGPSLRPWAPAGAPGARGPAGVLAAGLAAFVPVASWAHVWPIALAFAAAAALLYLEARLGGGVSRALHRWIFLPRHGRSARRELPGLLVPAAGRDADREALEAFVARWLAAGATERRGLLSEALEDPALWREKLVAAHLLGGREADAALEALRASPRGLLEPPAETVKDLLARSGESPFLDRAQARGALAGLAALAGAPQAAAPSPSRARRLLGGAAAAVAAAALLVAAYSGHRAAEFAKMQGQAERESLRIFYGGEAFAIDDRYRDPLIEREVLPLLRRWQKLGEADEPAMSRAVSILRSSADPKSDNLLLAIFQRADLLPLSPDSERLLISTLIERDNEGIWLHMRRAFEDRRPSPSELARLSGMFELASASGKERAFQHAFYFVKAPVPAVREAAAKTVRDSLSDPARGERFARIEALLERYQTDDVLLLEAERLALAQLARPGEPVPKEKGAEAVERILKRALEVTAKSDEWRPRAFETVPAGEEDARLVPPRVLGVLRVLEEELKKAPDSAALRWAARRQLDMVAKGLVEQAYSRFPGWYEEMKARRVLTHAGRVREAGYLKAHLRDFRAIVKARAAPGVEAAQRELAHRAERALGPMLAVAEAAGIANGDAPGERAADDAQGVLADARWVFSDGTFDIELAAKSLRDRHAYDAGDLAVLRAILERRLAEGRAPQHAVGAMGPAFFSPYGPMTAAQRRNLAEGIEHLAEIRSRWHPEAPPEPPTPAGLMRLLRDPDAEVRAKADRGLRAALGYDLTGMMRLWVAHMWVGRDNETSAWVVRYILEQVSRPGAADVDEGVVQGEPPVHWAFGGAAGELLSAGDAVMPWEEAARAWEAAAKGPGGVPPGLRGLMSRSLPWALNGYIYDAERAFPGLRKRLVEEGVVLQWRFNSGTAQRRDYRGIHYRLTREAVRAEAAATPAPQTPEQRRVEAQAGGYVDALLRLARLSGLPEGGGIEERAADWVNPVLQETTFLLGYGGDGCLKELQARKFVAAGIDTRYQNRLVEQFPQRYAKAELTRLLDFLKEVRASGQGWAPNGARMALLAWQRPRLDDAIARVEAILARY